MKRFLIFICAFVFSASQVPAQDNWTAVETSTLVGQLTTTISEGYIFRTKSGNYYMANNQKSQRIKLNSPQVSVLTDGKVYKLVIAGLDKPVLANKMEEVVESTLDGEFRGWSGKTTFTLINGQIWQQDTFSTLTANSVNRPTVFIYKTKDGYKLQVEDVEETLLVRRLR